MPGKRWVAKYRLICHDSSQFVPPALVNCAPGDVPRTYLPENCNAKVSLAVDLPESQKQMTKILIVEDDPILATTVSDALEFEHYMVETVDNGSKALEF